MIQKASGHIAAPAPTAGLSTPVVVIFLFVLLIRTKGHDGVIGAYLGAHGAPDTGLGQVAFLANAVIQAEAVFRFFGDPDGWVKMAFSKTPKFNGVYRTDSGALTAKGAFVLIPSNLP